MSPSSAADIVNNMLGPGDPLGKEIRVGGTPYTVVGVGEAQGKMFGNSIGQLGGRFRSPPSCTSTARTPP